MSYFDDVYCGLCKDILENGVQVHNRTGIDTIKVPSAHFHLDLSKEFPILTTKQLFIRQAVTEMLWIYQAQSNDVRWLQERNVHIWDKWEINEDGDWIDENIRNTFWNHQSKSTDTTFISTKTCHMDCTMHVLTSANH